MSDKRFTTGVQNLDEMLGGGVYKGVNILVKGGTGTGKTTFALQYLVSGARAGEKGIYLTFEESADQIIRYGSKFFPDIESLIKDQVIQIIDFSPHSGHGDKVHVVEGQRMVVPERDSVDSIAYIEDRILDIRGQTIQRVVVDGMQTFANTFYDLSGKSDVEALRKTISKILVLLKKEQITTYILSEETDEEGYDKYSFINFIVDGVFLLKVNTGLDVRTLRISKMRGIHHSLKPFAIELAAGEGIVFKSK